MTTIDEWIGLTDNKLNKDDVYIHIDHLGKLDLETIKSWILMEEHVKDYYNYYPLKQLCNGIRFACVYVNINKKSRQIWKTIQNDEFCRQYMRI